MVDGELLPSPGREHPQNWEHFFSRRRVSATHNPIPDALLGVQTELVQFILILINVGYEISISLLYI